MLETVKVTARQGKLIKYIQALDKEKRHKLTIVCRGTEPWEVLEHVTETKIELVPNNTKQ